MKILNIAYSLGKGGTERAAQNFAFGYADLGHDSRFLYTRLDGVRRNGLQQKNIPIYDLNDEAACSMIKEWGPDIVHLHSHGISPDEFRKIKELAPAAKYVETNVFSCPSPWVDDIDVSYQLSSWCEWLYKKRSTRKYPSAVVPYPVDTTAFEFSGEAEVRRFRESHGIEPDDIVIGRIGQHFNGKWSTSLIDVFEALRRSYRGLKLVVVNPPDPILGRAYVSPFRSDIIYLEQVLGDSNLATCYSAMDLFLLIAEQGESFGMVLAESLLCETPVVTLATPWGDNSQGEVIGNRVGGFVASSKRDLIRLVEKLINDPSLRQHLGRSGRDRIIHLYDSKRVASESLRVVSSGEFNSMPMAPLEMMRLSEGRLNVLSRLILWSERSFWLLRYSTGYESSVYIPYKISRRVLRLLRQWSTLVVSNKDCK